MKIFHSLGHVLGGALLIAGTTIGVGMLGMPVATASGGFLPAISLYLLCWVFMLCTGLLLLEVCIWMPKEANMITMASKLLGVPGKIICWAVYLFFFLAISIAHIASGGNILHEISGNISSVWIWTILYVVIFAPFVYSGTRTVDRFNLLLMAGLIITYLLFVFTSIPFVNVSLLEHRNWSKAWLALPILFTAFGYQAILPTLMNYMKRDVKKVRLAIFIGTAIPLVIYLVWEFLILSIIPLEGPNSLAEAMKLGQTAVIPLKAATQHPYLFSIGKAFSFFTMTASYIAISLAYLDFLADGLKWKKNLFNKFWLALFVFIPPLLISISYPHIFLIALGYAGGFACAILFGLFPPLMVWVGRHYKRYHDDTKQLFGGRYLLTVLILFVICEIAIEIASHFIPA